MFIAGCIIGGIGIIFLILGIILFLIGKSTWKCTGQTAGEIVDMCLNAFSYNHGGTGIANVGISLGADNAGSRCPVFVYQVNGVEYRRASNVSWNRGQIKKKMNQKRTIYYNPANPSEATLFKQSVLSIIGKVFFLIASIMIILGLVLLCL